MSFLVSILIIVVALIAILWWYLHRDPERENPYVNGYVSPANGIVVDIVKRNSKEEKAWITKGAGGITAWWSELKSSATIVVIMMKPQHIHTQRAPVLGRITKVEHRGGLKRNAVFGEWRRASVENEHLMYRIDGKRPCVVYAIAGLMARRIKPIATLGQGVRQSERICKITFGSQVAIILPKNTKILVKRGDTVIDGITPLAK